MIYFDNAATSWPKPPEVANAMTHFLAEIGASPGRSGHRSALNAGRLVYETREAVTELFHASDPLQVVFTHNITESLNLTLNGLLDPGDHVVTSSMEHNSMMRPLRELERHGVDISVIQCSQEGLLNPEHVESAVRPNTRMIALNHASNVIGTIQPAAKIGEIARQHKLLFLLDTAQTAGCYPIDMQTDMIDLLAFTGHKSLYGPTGTGGLIIGDRVDIAQFDPLIRGGTGSNSELEEQSTFLPDKFESGTMNAVGLAGLLASLCWLMECGVGHIREHEMALIQHLLDGLQNISGVTVYGTRDASRQTATVSFTLGGMDMSNIGLRLDEKYGILCRIGLHCSPAAHKTIDTFPEGTVRFGLGYFNTPEEIEQAVTAVQELATT